MVESTSCSLDTVAGNDMISGDKHRRKKLSCAGSCGMIDSSSSRNSKGNIDNGNIVPPQAQGLRNTLDHVEDDNNYKYVSTI